jgi:arginase
VADSDPIVVGAATSAGAYGPGQERAPEYLRAHGLVDALVGTGRPVRDAGNVATFVHRPDPEHPQAANVEQVREAALSVAGAVSAAYTRGEDVPVLGGDCTIEIGTVAGALADGSSVGLIFIDLEGDPNTPATGDGFLDWMGLAHILDIDGVEPRLADAGPRPVVARRWAMTTAPRPGSPPRPQRPGAAPPAATTASGHHLSDHPMASPTAWALAHPPRSSRNWAT